MNFVKLKSILQTEPSFRIKQIKEAVFKNFVSSWSEASNLSKALKERLEQEMPLEIKGEIETAKNQNTLKAVLVLQDQKKCETVLMKHQARNTICVSTQVGCPLTCVFCLTGKMGFSRDLKSEEIIDQVLFWARFLRQKNQKITNVVFMGMGEALLNYDEVMKAIRVINQEIGIGSRKISISTVGIIKGIEKLAKEPEQINLAVSLHAPNNKLRSQLMPINNKYPLEKLLPALRGYIEKTNRKVMIEYLMLEGVNDSPDQARELASLLKTELGDTFMVNLISYNPTGGYKATPNFKIKHFKSILERHKIETIQRYRFGQDIKGACGQLAGK